MNEQKNGILPKFKIGDEVELICDVAIVSLKKGTRFTVQRIQKNGITPTQITYSYTDYIENRVRKPVVAPFFVIPEKYLKLVECHEGKVLIMVDEKDNNKIIARDLVTGKKAEAKRNPNDEWDFEKGAKLAFERLYPEKKEEKPKYWTGKVICVSANWRDEERKHSLYWQGNPFFTIGKVYKVIDGRIMHDGTEDGECIPQQTVTSLENLLNPGSIECPRCCRFIEYKGEV